MAALFTFFQQAGIFCTILRFLHYDRAEVIILDLNKIYKPNCIVRFPQRLVGLCAARHPICCGFKKP